MGGKKKYIETFGSFTEPLNCSHAPCPTLYVHLRNEKVHIIKAT